MPEVLIFDIWADYAHFKKPYTTVSPLTYGIPSRTTITGILGAILGVAKNENNLLFNHTGCNISLAIVNPIKKTMINQNLINTKNVRDFTPRYPTFLKGKIQPPRSQIGIEYLKDAAYRIYVELFDPALHDKLRSCLENHETVYTVSLGLSENLANFRFIGAFSYEAAQGDTDLRSVLLLDGVDQSRIDFTGSGHEYFTDNFPLAMKENREVTRYGTILYERTGKPIAVRGLEYVAIKNGDAVCWI